MAEIQVPNVRQETTVLLPTRLKDNGVTVDWPSLGNIKAYMYSEVQRVIAGKCSVEVDGEDSAVLNVTYPATRPQYLGVNSLLVRCKYQGREKTFDLPVLNFVERTAEATGVTVLDDPVVNVELEVDEVSTSLLDGAIAAALDAAVEAEDAAEAARDAIAEMSDRFVPKAGGSMNAGARLLFVNADRTALARITDNEVSVGSGARDSAALLAGGIRVTKTGVYAEIVFPSKGGIFALLDDIPEVVKSLTPQSTDTEVPSAKTVYDAIQAGGGGGASNVFVAVYEETTLAEVAAAIAAGKVVLCNYEGVMLPLVEYYADPNDSIFSVTFQHLVVDPADSDATIGVETLVLNTQGWEDLGFSIATNEVEIFDNGAPYEDMRAAVDDGKVVIYRQAGLYFPLVSSTGSHLIFEHVRTSGSAVYISGYDIGQSGSSPIERRLALFSDINVYIANADDTTFDDISTAREKGKTVLLYVNDGIDDEGFCTLANITDTTYTFAAIRNFNGVPRAVFHTIDNNDEWSTVAMDLAKVSDIPTVPTDVVKYSSQSLTEQQKTQARTNIGAGTYSKPSSGIPASDLASGVIPAVPTDVVKYSSQSLTAAQKAQARTNIGAGTSSFSGSYADLTNKPTIPTVPAISTKIAADKTSNTKTASPAAVYNEVHPGIVTSQPAGGFAPNILYNLGELTGAVTFALAAEVSGIVNHYYWTFDTGATESTITWPAGITSWVGGSAPTIAASKHYEISVLNGIGAYMEV